MMIEMKAFDENTGKVLGAVMLQGNPTQDNLLRTYRALRVVIEGVPPEPASTTYKEPE